jgi:hypothetical protein
VRPGTRTNVLVFGAKSEQKETNQEGKTLPLINPVARGIGEKGRLQEPTAGSGRAPCEGGVKTFAVPGAVTKEDDGRGAAVERDIDIEDRRK